jgi:MFS transporter, DHA1 family, tetracycline resistance protein
MMQEIQKRKLEIYTLISLFMVIALDTIGVGMVWPMFGPLFMSPSESIFPVETSIFIRNLLYGITLGVFPLCMFFGAPVLGDLSDRVGRKKVLLICMYGSAIGLSVCLLGVLWRNVALLILGRAILGVLAGSQATAQAAIIDISPIEKKAASIGIISVAGKFGLIVGPMIGGILIDREIVSWFGTTTPFIFAALLSLLNAIVLNISFRETFQLPTAQYHQFASRIKTDFTKGISLVISALTNKKISLLALSYFLFQLGWSLYFMFNVTCFVQFHGYSSVEVGYFLASLAAVFALSVLVVTRVMLRYFTIEKIVPWVLFGVALFVMIAGANTETILWISMVPAAGCAAIANNGLITLISNQISQDEQGWIMGVLGSMSALAWGCGALLGGSLSALHSAIPFMIGGVSMFIAWKLLVLKLRTYKHCSG